MPKKSDQAYRKKIIVLYLEARLVAEGTVNTADASYRFDIARQNMYQYVKYWQDNFPGIKLDRSIKGFVAAEGRKSPAFKKKQAARDYLAQINELYNSTYYIAQQSGCFEHYQEETAKEENSPLNQRRKNQ